MADGGTDSQARHVTIFMFYGFRWPACSAANLGEPTLVSLNGEEEEYKSIFVDGNDEKLPLTWAGGAAGAAVV